MPAQCIIYLILAGLHVQKHSCPNVSLAPYISHCVRDSRAEIGGQATRQLAFDPQRTGRKLRL